MRKIGVICLLLLGVTTLVVGGIPSKKSGLSGKIPSRGVLRDRTRIVTSLPDSIMNLAFWYKADSGVYSDAGTTLATNGQSVQQWNDQSSNNRHMSALGASFKPVYATAFLNGKAGLKFTSDCMIATATISKPITFFVVYGYTSLATGKNILLIGDNNGGTALGTINIGAAGALNNAEGSTSTSWNGGAALTEGSTITVSGNFGAGRSVRVNEAVNTIAADDIQASWTHIILGNIFDGSFGPTNANFFELIGYNRALTTAEKQTVLDYLQAKWGHY